MTVHDLVHSFGFWPNPRYNYLVVDSDFSVLLSNNMLYFNEHKGCWEGSVAERYEPPKNMLHLPVDWHTTVAEWADFH